MHTHIKTNFLFYTFTLLICFNSFFLINTPAQVDESVSDNYTFETIDVPDVDFLAVAASSDFEDYAGYTKSPDSEKEVAFTLIDGVFTTYDFPGAQNTYFFALGNNGNAAGHYEDSNGLFHRVVLENGELREYNFPDSVETEIYGISDATGALTGNFTDAEGIRRGFTGDEIIEFPGAVETFADFINSQGGMVGSYVDADGLYHPYVRTPTGRFVSLALPQAPNLEYFFVHGINDAQTVVARTKRVDSPPITLVGTFQGGLQSFKVPDSVSTEGYNINQDGSIVGHYDSADGRRHGFIARPTQDTDESVGTEPVVVSADGNYTFETIDVPGAEILVLTASSDFADYAGNTRSSDGEKEIGFTLIDGVFTTYDFPGSKNTYFYALGNNGNAAGHYEDSNGLFHGVVLENGELREYNFPNAVQTEIYGISDATGALTGNFTDASGVRRGFSGDTIIEVPEASATFADFVNAGGTIVGSYIDADGLYHPYYMRPDGRFITIDAPERAANREYLFVHGINDSGFSVSRIKLWDDIPRTYVGRVREGSIELRFPGSVSTEGWNINQDGSIVGNYESPDGRRHGFIARPASQVEAENYSNTYTVTLSKGLNMLSVPLAPPTPMTAKSLVAMTGATTIITLDVAKQDFIAWTPGAPDDGFPIEGGKGYIVNVPEIRNFAFVGAPWTDPTEAAAPAITPLIRGDRGVVQEAWAFVVSGHLEGKPTFDGYQVSVRNLRTNSRITAPVQGDYFAAATADLTRRSVVQVGDVVEVRVIGPDGNFESQTLSLKVTPEHLSNAVLSVRFDSIGTPTQNLLMQNYPNPFNPETWIPYQLSEDSPVSISIYDTTGRLVRTLALGFQSAGFYSSQGRAAYWDGRNALGERVASGIYFYQLITPTFHQTRRLVILK
ncbi:MAG: T9SS type A sorting domain-containing protein [Candidatus Poribacteria bacterium]|nr:T9SS type A sorting domain-containing protein [Candidatus Poribacteria bacterium]